MVRPLRSFCRRVQRSSGLVGVASDGARFAVAVPNPRTFGTVKDSLVRMVSRIRSRDFVASKPALTGPVSDVAEGTLSYFQGLTLSPDHRTRRTNDSPVPTGNGHYTKCAVRYSVAPPAPYPRTGALSTKRPGPGSDASARASRRSEKLESRETKLAASQQHQSPLKASRPTSLPTQQALNPQQPSISPSSFLVGWLQHAPG